MCCCGGPRVGRSVSNSWLLIGLEYVCLLMGVLHCALLAALSVLSIPRIPAHHTCQRRASAPALRYTGRAYKRAGAIGGMKLVLLKEDLVTCPGMSECDAIWR